jgi:4-hydroxybenzoate polyprenyltransferase
LLAWLQLVRLPTVFTALADILLGTQLVAAADATTSPRTLGLLLVASAGLYLAGMVFNDVFDRHRDAVERPGRPLPSGRITLSSAVTLGTVLMIGGVVAAATADGSSSRASLLVALGLAICVLAYDGLLKTTPLGPLAMGACRSLNVLLGATAGGSLETLAQGPPLHVAAGLGIYITGVTWFARNEAGSSTRGQLTAAVLLINIGLATLITFAGMSQTAQQQDATTSVLLLMALIVVSINRRLIAAIRDPRPERVQSGVGILLLSLIMIDATLALAASGRTTPALLIASLMIPALVLKRWIRMT